MRNEKLCYRKAIRKGVGMKLWVRPLQEERKKNSESWFSAHPSPAQTLAFPERKSSKNRCLAFDFYFY